MKYQQKRESKTKEQTVVVKVNQRLSVEFCMKIMVKA